jgi:hypothetical protein
MDWNRAIDINQSALVRIVAMLMAMVGLAHGGSVERLARPVYNSVARLLRPAESALRRLIVIAARGLVVKPQPTRPMPAGLSISGKGNMRPAFRLFDQRKRFERIRRRGKVHGIEPRVHFMGESPLVPLFRPAFRPIVQPEDDGTVSAARLCRRLVAIKLALDDLPRQAIRLARWQARRNKLENPKFKSPLRPGRPPGFRKEPRHEVEALLRECHGLALDALADTS